MAGYLKGMLLKFCRIAGASCGLPPETASIATERTLYEPIFEDRRGSGLSIQSRRLSSFQIEALRGSVLPHTLDTNAPRKTSTRTRIVCMGIGGSFRALWWPDCTRQALGVTSEQCNNTITPD